MGVLLLMQAQAEAIGAANAQVKSDIAEAVADAVANVEGGGSATAEAEAVATAVGTATATAISDAYVKVYILKEIDVVTSIWYQNHVESQNRDADFSVRQSSDWESL